MRLSDKIHGALMVVFVAIVALIISAFVGAKPDVLTVAFLDVGQGDAIFVESPTGNQIMIDGGPDRTVLRELGKVMPFYDKTIDALFISNPDKDHFAGFVDVLGAYDVQTVVEPGTKTDTAVYKEFTRRAEAEGAKKIVAERGTVFDLGGGAVLTVLFPDRDASSLKTNDGSLIMRLTYGKNEFLFMGDAPESVENYLSVLDKKNLESDVLKVGHHGSNTSTGQALLAAVRPTLAIISAGEGNKYGHPHKEVVQNLQKFNIQTLVTNKNGRIVIYSDGNRVWKK